MPRHKQIRVSIKDLSCGDELKSELARMKSLAGFDLDRAEVVVKQRPAPVIKNAEQTMRNLEQYHANNRHLIQTIDGRQLVNKKDLARMMKISRPTLDRWIAAGFIAASKTPFPDVKLYQISEVISQLLRYQILTFEKEQAGKKPRQKKRTR